MTPTTFFFLARLTALLFDLLRSSLLYLFLFSRSSFFLVLLRSLSSNLDYLSSSGHLSSLLYAIAYYFRSITHVVLVYFYFASVSFLVNLLLCSWFFRVFMFTSFLSRFTSFFDFTTTANFIRFLSSASSFILILTRTLFSFHCLLFLKDIFSSLFYGIFAKLCHYAMRATSSRDASHPENSRTALISIANFELNFV